MNKLYNLTKGFLNVISPIFLFRYSEECLSVVNEALRVYLSAYNALECQSEMMDIIKDTFILQTEEDCMLLEDFDLSEYSTPREFFSLKKQMLIDMKIFANNTFTLTFFNDLLNDCAKCGDLRACRLKAYIAWANGEKELSMRLWEMLAYWGDVTSMKALIFGAEKLKMTDTSHLWQRVYPVFKKDYYAIFELYKSEDMLSYEESKTIDLIRSIANARWIKDKSNLNFALLDYVINSQDPQEEIVRNVLRGDLDFYRLKRGESLTYVH